jgi:hypothetical protein
MVAVAGEARVAAAMANGMEAVRPCGAVSEVAGPMIREIDGRPARDVILDAVVGSDEKARAQFVKVPGVYLIEHQVGIASWSDELGMFQPHYPFGFGDDGAMLDIFEARVGSKLAVVRLDVPSCLSAIKEVAAATRQGCGGAPELALAFSCAVRGFTLGASIREEDRVLRESLEARSTLVVAANGEIGVRAAGAPLSTSAAISVLGLVG